MKRKVKNIFRYVISIFLAFCIITLVIVNVSKSTILDKNYVLSKIEKTGYYVKIYSFVKENFRKHIQQSGLEESILDELITQEQIIKDTNTIITNIYNNVREEVSTAEIKEKLTKRIEEQTRGMLVTTNQKEEINKFIDDICNEYLVGISQFNIEKEFYNAFQKTEKVIELLKKIALIGIVVGIIVLIIICKNRPYKFFVFSGISMLASGTFFVIINIFINVKVNVQAITVLNEAFSFTLREVIETILNEINQKGIVLLIIGLIFVLVPTAIHTYIKNKKYLVE